MHSLPPPTPAFTPPLTPVPRFTPAHPLRRPRTTLPHVPDHHPRATLDAEDPLPTTEPATSPADTAFLRTVQSRRPGAPLIAIVEACAGAPWSFRGERLYLVDLAASECDVLEHPTATLPPPPAPAAPAPLRALLLPSGWPGSVAPGYARWVLWHVGRQLFRNAYYVLGTTSLLYALGLGTGEALALGGALKWVLKDGLGMATKLGVSTRLAAVVDRDPKRWRFVGDSLMVCSVALEILSMTRPACFLLFGTGAALLKEAGGAMSGPSYRVFLDAFAVNANIGDVSSRGEAQVVVGNLVGLGLGAAVSAFLGSTDGPERLLPTLAFYAVLAFGHMTCTFNAVSTVQLKTLNWQRLNLVVDEFLATGKVPRVEDVNSRERFIYAASPPPSQQRLRIGAQLLDFVECGRDVSRALRNRKDRFIVAYNNDCAGIMLREDVQPRDVLRAFLQARRLLVNVDASRTSRNLARKLTREELGKLTKESYEWAERGLPGFLGGLDQQGWSTKKLLIPMGESRFRESTALE